MIEGLEVRITLFALSGSKQRALDSIGAGYPGAEITCVSRADFSSKAAMQVLREFRNIRADVFIIYCQNLETQQKLHLLQALSLVTRARKKLLADEKGRVIRCSLARSILISIPTTLLEFILSGFVIAATYLIIIPLHLATKADKNGASRFGVSTGSGPLKIAFLRTNFWFDLKAGGSVSHIAGFTGAIAGLGHRLFFISTDKLENIDTSRMPIYTVKPSRIFNTIVEIAGIAFNFKYLWKALGIIKKERPDFLYQRYDAFIWCGIVISKIMKVPIVIEYNGSEVWKGKRWGSMRFLHLARLIEETVLYSGDRIVAISGVVRDDLIKLGISEKKIILNPNGVDPDMFNPGIDGTEIRRKYQIQDRTVVGFLGTFGLWHGIPVLVEAVEPVIKEDKNIHFLLIGDGELRDSVERAIEEKNLSKHVTITGIVPHSEAPKYLAACDILASPHVPNMDGTPFFGSPTKLFEYMAMGKGIVASDLFQIGEALQNGLSAILVEPGNVQQLAEGILKLAADKGLREKLGRQARKEAVRNYTWEQNAVRVIRAMRGETEGG